MAGRTRIRRATRLSGVSGVCGVSGFAAVPDVAGLSSRIAELAGLARAGGRSAAARWRAGLCAVRAAEEDGLAADLGALPDAPALARLDKLAPPQVSCLFDAFREQRHRGPTIGGGDAWAQSAQQERPPPAGRKRYTWVMQRARDNRAEPAGALGVEVGVRPVGT